MEIFLNDVRNMVHKNFKDKETAQKIEKTKKMEEKKNENIEEIVQYMSL